MERIRLLRENKGISQQSLADRIGCTQPTIHKYEDGSNEPDIQTLRLLADFFDTSVDYLIGHTDIPHKIEPVQPWELNAAEASLMEKYRRCRLRPGAGLLSVADISCMGEWIARTGKRADEKAAAFSFGHSSGQAVRCRWKG